MTWLRVDDAMVDHPKVEGLSDAAFRLHLRVMSYCARFSTDGDIPRAKALQMCGRQKLIDECLGAGLWEHGPSIYTVHDFLVYNPSKADLDRKAIAGAKGAAIRYGRADAIAGASQDAIAPARDPVPAQPGPISSPSLAAPDDPVATLYWRHLGHNPTAANRDELAARLLDHPRECVEWVLSEVGGSKDHSWRICRFKFKDCDTLGAHGPRSNPKAKAFERVVQATSKEDAKIAAHDAELARVRAIATAKS